MTLVVTEAGCASPDGYCIDTWGSFPTPVVINTTSANNGLGNGLLQINTPYSYDVDFSKGTAKLVVEKVFNGSPSYTTGVLRLELWATSNPYSGGAISGHRIASYGFNAGGASGQLAPSGAYNKVNVSVPVETTPPLGTYYVTMVLSEFSSACPTADHYCLVDYGPFSSPLIMQPSDNGGGGGGGSTDALLLALLLLALAHRWLGAQRRRARVA
jgi:hypothetical protein